MRGVRWLVRRYRRVWPPMWLVLAAGVICLRLSEYAVNSTYGFDAYAYWRLPHFASLYAGSSDAGGFGVYRYSPAFAQAVSVLWPLDFPSFLLAWTMAALGTVLWLTGWRRLVYGIAIAVAANEVYFGNIHILLAAAILIGFRHPAAYAFVLLTKVTPGIGLLWFAARREWRSLGIALAATACVAAASVAVGGTGPWVEWGRALAATAPAADGPNVLLAWLPLPLRLVIAAVLVVAGARSGARWAVFAAAVISLPTIWAHGTSILIGILGLRWLDTRPPWTVRDLRRRLQRAADPARGLHATARE